MDIALIIRFIMIFVFVYLGYWFVSKHKKQQKEK